MASVFPPINVLVELDGKEGIVTPAFLFLVAFMDTVFKHLNVFVILVMGEDSAMFVSSSNKQWLLMSLRYYTFQSFLHPLILISYFKFFMCSKAEFLSVVVLCNRNSMDFYSLIRLVYFGFYSKMSIFVFLDNQLNQTTSTTTNSCCCINKTREPLLPMLPLIPEHSLQSDSSSSTQCPLRPRPTSLYSLSHTRTLPHPPRYLRF